MRDRRMNTNPRARRLGLVTAVATLAALTLLVAACGSSSGKQTATAAAPPSAALKYAQCMRANGVPNFPDPDANGGFGGIQRKLAGDPGFQAAQQACRGLAPGGVHQSSAPGFVAQLRTFAQCMRKNGLPQFPDPDANRGFPPGTEQFQADPNFPGALQACFGKLPAGMRNHEQGQGG